MVNWKISITLLEKKNDLFRNLFTSCLTILETGLLYARGRVSLHLHNFFINLRVVKFKKGYLLLQLMIKEARGVITKLPDWGTLQGVELVQGIPFEVEKYPFGVFAIAPLLSPLARGFWVDTRGAAESLAADLAWRFLVYQRNLKSLRPEMLGRTELRPAEKHKHDYLLGCLEPLKPYFALQDRV